MVEKKDISRIVYKGGTGEIVEKKSRFIAQVFSVETEEEVQSILEETKKKYWDARHNCYAFILGSRREITRCSDDGEPSGTAGRPILEVMLGMGLYNALVVVTRYFGGTLLGTGGLVRAYAQSAKEGLEQSELLDMVSGKKLEIQTDYVGIGKLQYITAQMEVPVVTTTYDEVVTMIVAVPSEQCDELLHKTTEATAGKAVVKGLEETVVFGLREGNVVFPE